MLKRLTLFLAGFLLCVGLPFARTERGLSVQAQAATPEPTAPFEDFYGTLPTLEALFRTNGGCELPCWWGFRLGEVSDEEWLGFLWRENLFNVIDDGPQHELGTAGGQWSAFSIGGYRHPISSLFDENGTLIQLQIQVNEPRKWLPPSANAVSFPSLLNQLDGIPEVYIFARSSLRDYGIVVIDANAGLMAKYSFDFWTTVPANQENYAEERSFCLGMAYTKRIEITLQIPSVEPPLGERERPEIRAEGDQTYIPVEEMTFGRINANEFISFFRERPDECLVIERTGLADGT